MCWHVVALGHARVPLWWRRGRGRNVSSGFRRRLAPSTEPAPAAGGRQETHCVPSHHFCRRPRPPTSGFTLCRRFTLLALLLGARARRRDGPRKTSRASSSNPRLGYRPRRKGLCRCDSRISRWAGDPVGSRVPTRCFSVEGRTVGVREQVWPQERLGRCGLRARELDTARKRLSPGAPRRDEAL